jgi:hypothetical protein
MGLLYGRAGRLTALFGGFRPGQMRVPELFTFSTATVRARPGRLSALSVFL